MSQREDTISLILVRTPGTPEQLTQLRRELLAKTTVELDKIADEQTLAQYRAQAARQVATERHPQIIAAEQQAIDAAAKLWWAELFGTPINDRVIADTQANRSIIHHSWIDEIRDGETINHAATWLKRVLTENPSLASTVSWQSADVLDPKKRQQAAAAQDQQDRETFNQFARTNNFSEVAANFHVAKSVLGSGFDQYALSQAVQSGVLQLAQASPEEIATFQQDAAEARADYLRNHATPEELRQAAETESGQRRIQAQQEFVRKQDQAGREREAALGKPQLPQTNHLGERLDAAFFNKLSVVNREEFRRYVNMFGGNQIVDRMRGIR